MTALARPMPTFTIMPWRTVIRLPACIVNAILNYGGGSIRGATVYSTLFPCNECAKALIQAGVKRVVYLSDKYADQDSFRASKLMFKLAGVTYDAYELTGRHFSAEL